MGGNEHVFTPSVPGWGAEERMTMTALRLDSSGRHTSSLHPLIRKLETNIDLSAEEKKVIAELPFVARSYPPDHDIVREHERPTHCVVILEGFACRYKVLEVGKRQIFSFHIPGDMPDAQSLMLDVMDHSLATLVPTLVAVIHHDVLRQLLRTQPRIAEAVWRDTLVDAAVFREWMANVGRRDAYARAAHLLCELYTRMRAVGLTRDGNLELPVTQEELADAMGLSTVHVNRTLQQLRGEKLITQGGRKVIILDWEGLQRAGQFDATYLHIRPGAAKA
jgi:CRP-like cAMP-binding protein